MTAGQLIDYLMKEHPDIKISGTLIINPINDDKRTLSIQANYNKEENIKSILYPDS